MNFGFERAHGYTIEKGFINDCESLEDAIRKVNSGECSDIIDEYDTNDMTSEYEIIDIWELK